MVFYADGWPRVNLPGRNEVMSEVERRLRFEELRPALLPVTLESLRNNNFTVATPVQQAVIPQLLLRKDVVVQACTGSGKTLAFVVPMFEMLARRADPLRCNQVSSLIIEPTRELASQVCDVVSIFHDTRGGGFHLLSLVGGVKPNEDEEFLRSKGCNVVVGTPGRIEDTLKRLGTVLNVHDLDLLILDEADRLLDMGFEATLNSILAMLPKQRRTGLFSATQTTQVDQLARSGLRNPVRVDVRVSPLEDAAQATPSTLSNYYQFCELERKLDLLVSFLREHSQERVIVYVLTCASVDYFGQMLPALPLLKDVAIRPLHGKMPHVKRSATYAWYRKQCAAGGRGAVLVCTDVAARGLDIPDVEWIVQYDAPQDPNTFVHRVGRAARMGRRGSSLLLLTPEEEAYIHFLKIRRVPLQEQEQPNLTSTLVDARRALLTDRALVDKAVRAFVAHVRAYKEHQLKYVFEFNKLNLGALATSHALLKMPKLSELRFKNREHFEQHMSRFVSGLAGRDSPDAADAGALDLDSIGYKDASKEKRRQQALAEKKERPSAGRHVRDKEVQREARRLKRKAQRHAKAQEKAAQRRHEESNELEDDFASETRALKRFRRGKISEAELDAVFGYADEGSKAQGSDDDHFTDVLAMDDGRSCGAK